MFMELTRQLSDNEAINLPWVRKANEDSSEEQAREAEASRLRKTPVHLVGSCNINWNGLKREINTHASEFWKDAITQAGNILKEFTTKGDVKDAAKRDSIVRRDFEDLEKVIQDARRARANTGQFSTPQYKKTWVEVLKEDNTY